MTDTWRFDAIGTRWEIETAAPLAASVRASVEALVEGFDRAWSRFRPDSEVSRLAASGGTLASTDAAPMFALYRELSDATGAAVNPLVGDALARRGYDAGYSFVDRGTVATPSDWPSIVGWDDASLRVDRGAMLDIGALGKGRLVDLVADVVGAHVEAPFVVDASGDMAVRGGPVRVALEHPYDASRAIGVIEVADAALCASATNRRAWGEGLHHVLDARTGVPVRRIAATWALAADAMHADAAATALFFDGGPEIAAHWGVSWVRMTTDGAVEWSPDRKAELFL